MLGSTLLLLLDKRGRGKGECFSSLEGHLINMQSPFASASIKRYFFRLLMGKGRKNLGRQEAGKGEKSKSACVVVGEKSRKMIGSACRANLSLLKKFITLFFYTPYCKLRAIQYVWFEKLFSRKIIL